MPTLQTRQIGDLNCHVITAERPELLLVLCHGFGAPGDDLVQIGAYLLETNPELVDRVVIAFPEAPLSLTDLGMPGGRAWWPLDMEKLNRAAMSGDFRDLREESPELLPVAREKLNKTIEILQTELNLTNQQTVIGGFSQGSMLATDSTLHASQKYAGLIIWSGTLLNESAWRPLSPTLSGIPIVQSHGTSDQILPFAAAGWLREMLNAGGANLKFLEFSGGHTIPPESLDAAALLVNTVLDQAAPGSSSGA